VEYSQRPVAARGHTDDTRSIVAIALGKVDKRTILASARLNDTFRLWDALNGFPWGEPPKGHTDSVLSLALGEVGGVPLVAFGGKDMTVRLWDAVNGEPRGELKGHRDSVVAIALGEVDGRPAMASGVPTGR
jgi:WD40 repeat protein